MPSHLQTSSQVVAVADTVATVLVEGATPFEFGVAQAFDPDRSDLGAEVLKNL